MKKAIFFAIALCLIVPISYAKDKDVTLTWTMPSTPNDLVGFYVSWGEIPGGPYPNTDFVAFDGAKPEYTFVVKMKKVKKSGPRYYVIQAVDSSGNVSGYSNEVPLNVDISGGPPDDTTPPPAPQGATGEVTK